MKRINIIMLLLCTVLLLTGCADNTVTKYILPSSFSSAENAVVDENDNFAMLWDNSAYCVLLKDKQTDYIWSTTPYSLYASGETGYSVSSPIAIEYYDLTDNSIQIEKASDCIDAGTVSSKTEGKKLYVSYYFTTPEITVTVCYTLRNDSLKVSVSSDDLVETGKTKLINVSLTPYLCAVPNSSQSSSYLFVPSGSGAVMYADEEPGGANRDYSQEVYGNDPARTQLDNPADEEPVRLPCFGATDGANAMFAIVEGEAGAARIEANAGNPDIGFSNAYTTFNVRGYNNIEWDNGEFHGQETSNDTVMLSDSWPSGREFAVGYYPLKGEKTDYNGMAERYRNYLTDSDMLKKSDMDQKAYQVILIGGALTKRFFLGIPYNAFLTITDFRQAKTICSQLLQDYGETPAVLLKGFGKYGMDSGEIAGGYKLSPSLGGKKMQTAFENFCSNSQIPVFTDFDLIKFQKSGSGFSTFFDSAQTANSETVSYYPKKKNLRTDDTELKSIKFLSRDCICEAAQKLISTSSSEVSGISLASFASTLYSDYDDEKYMLKGAAEEQSREILGTIRKAGHTILLSAANAYAAGMSDGITDVPLQNGSYNSLDAAIPFYQMVYGGSIPLYSTPVNLALDTQSTILRAVEAGVSPSFTLGYKIDTVLTDNSESIYYGISYENNLKLIENTLKQTGDYYKKISGAAIRNHQIIKKNITKTVFDNGIIVYVNHSAADATAEGVTIPAMSFVSRKDQGGN